MNSQIKKTLLFFIVAFFSAEIITSTTKLEINFNLFMTLFLYLLLTLLAFKIIIKLNLNIVNIFLLGFILGIVEETIIINNPFPMNLLLAFGHAMVTYTFPFLIVNNVFSIKRDLFCGKGTTIYEKIVILFSGLVLSIFSRQGYLGLIIITAWLLIRQKTFSKIDFYFLISLYIFFHFVFRFLAI